MPLTEKAEAEAILWPRLNALEAMSWHELDSYGEKQELVDAPGGRKFRIVTGAFWDMDEWASGMELYAKAYAGEIGDFTGVSAPYEPPAAPDLVIHTQDETVADSAARVLELLR